MRPWEVVVEAGTGVRLPRQLRISFEMKVSFLYNGKYKFAMN
jgi:hypothetical protein